jgi:hypothetical protein
MKLKKWEYGCNSFAFLKHFKPMGWGKLSGIHSKKSIQPAILTGILPKTA